MVALVDTDFEFDPAFPALSSGRMAFEDLPDDDYVNDSAGDSNGRTLIAGAVLAVAALILIVILIRSRNHSSSFGIPVAIDGSETEIDKLRLGSPVISGIVQIGEVVDLSRESDGTTIAVLDIDAAHADSVSPGNQFAASVYDCADGQLPCVLVGSAAAPRSRPEPSTYPTTSPAGSASSHDHPTTVRIGAGQVFGLVLVIAAVVAILMAIRWIVMMFVAITVIGIVILLILAAA